MALVVICVCTLGGAGAGVVWLAPMTRVSQIVVRQVSDGTSSGGSGGAATRGLDQANRRAIDRAAESALGQPLVEVDTQAIESRVVALGRYRKVVVDRGWPDAIRIAVLPRVPVLAVAAPGRQADLLDESATAYERVQKEPTDLPVAHLA
ncbi:MAG: FtsQ-type POTRA domain-containing protein, partial [Micrococcales bacterium]|nr:FtsQ-type POTRA domain-containing protein [Micrococcales bacterium]